MNSNTSPLSTNYYNIRDYGNEDSSVNYDLSVSDSPISVNKKYVNSSKKLNKKYTTGYREFPNIKSHNTISEYTYTETPDNKDEGLSTSDIEQTENYKIDDYSYGIPDVLPNETIASDDEYSKNNEKTKNAFYSLFGETKKAHNNNKYKGHTVNPEGGIQGQIINNLPDGFNGRLPDHLQDKMQMPLNMPQNMPQNMGYSMPPEMARMAMGNQNMGYSMTSEMAPMSIGNQNMAPTLQDGILNNSQSIQSVMPPQNSMSMNTNMNGLNDHASLFPQNMMMNKNTQMNMNSIGSASIGMANPYQQGGSKKKFFFSKGEELR